MDASQDVGLPDFPEFPDNDLIVPKPPPITIPELPNEDELVRPQLPPRPTPKPTPKF